MDEQTEDHEEDESLMELSDLIMMSNRTKARRGDRESPDESEKGWIS